MGRFGEIAHKAKRMEGLMNTKHFGAKHGARHKTAQSRALAKKQGKDYPF